MCYKIFKANHMAAFDSVDSYIHSLVAITVLLWSAGLLPSCLHLKHLFFLNVNVIQKLDVCSTVSQTWIFFPCYTLKIFAVLFFSGFLSSGRDSATNHRPQTHIDQWSIILFSSKVSSSLMLHNGGVDEQPAIMNYLYGLRATLNWMY